MTSAFVLAAGHGTRLRPLTDYLPKPLVWIAGRPALDRVLEDVQTFITRSNSFQNATALEKAGRIVVNAHHFADAIERHLLERWPEVLISRELELLGTAGGLHAAEGLLGSGPVLVWNADIHGEMDEDTVLDLLRICSSRDYDGALVVRRRTNHQGNVGLDRSGRIVRLRQQSIAVDARACEETAEENSKARSENKTSKYEETRSGDYLGICALSERARSRLPDRGCLVGDFFLPQMGELDLRAIETDAPWIDVGEFGSYLDANLRYLDAKDVGHIPLARYWPGVRRDASNLLDHEAIVDDAVTLDRCVVGRGAKITGSGRAFECVVWPQAHLVAPAHRCIATPWGTVS